MKKLKRIKKETYMLIFLLMTIISITAVTYLITEILYPIKYTSIIEKYAKEYDLSLPLVYSVIQTESRFRVNAKSHRNAMGLMQITEQTANWAASEIGIENFTTSKLFDPYVNIQIGCWYLGKLQKQYDGNVKLMLAAYNAGPGNIARWLNDEKYSADNKNLDIIPFGETRRYVEKIEKNIKIYKLLLAKGYQFQKNEAHTDNGHFLVVF